MRRLLAAAALVSAVACTGCGGSPGDLLALGISGGPAGGNDTLVVSIDGLSSCNRGPQKQISSSQLLVADSIERDAQPLATRAATFPSGPTGGRSFTLRTQAGSVQWRESSRDLPAVLPRAELFGLELQRQLCHR